MLDLLCLCPMHNSFGVRCLLRFSTLAVCLDQDMVGTFVVLAVFFEVIADFLVLFEESPYICDEKSDCVNCL